MMESVNSQRAFLLLGVFVLLVVACDVSGGAQNGSGTVDAHPIQPTLRPEITRPALAPRATTLPSPTVPPVTPTAVPAPSATPNSPVIRQSDAELATDGGLFLQMVSPLETEVLTSEPSLDIVGRTRIDAFVTINDTVVELGIDGQFSLGIDLEEGPNIIEVVASVARGEQKTWCWWLSIFHERTCSLKVWDPNSC